MIAVDQRIWQASNGFFGGGTLGSKIEALYYANVTVPVNASIQVSGTH
jgi:hypothetical protein